MHFCSLIWTFTLTPTHTQFQFFYFHAAHIISYSKFIYTHYTHFMFIWLLWGVTVPNLNNKHAWWEKWGLNLRSTFPGNFGIWREILVFFPPPPIVHKLWKILQLASHLFFKIWQQDLSFKTLDQYTQFCLYTLKQFFFSWNYCKNALEYQSFGYFLFE